MSERPFTPTAEEIQKFIAWQCTQQGHLFSTITTEQSMDPVAVICDNCGRTWKVCGGDES